MTTPVKINTIRIENTKRVKAVQMDCTGSALTLVGGKNGEGKTSVLDAIVWALGGDRYRPTGAKRDESLVPPEIELTLSNGIHVERRGKNSALKVTDTNGMKAGQKLLDEFIHTFALDLPRFLYQNTKDKAQTLLNVIGIGDQLATIERNEKKLYDERHGVGVIADQKEKFSREMPTHADVPEQPVSAVDLINEQQEILARNGENRRKRDAVGQYEWAQKQAADKVESLKRQLADAHTALQKADEDLATARTSAKDLHDACVDEIKDRIEQIETTNAKVRANLDKAKAIEDAERHRQQYDELTEQLDKVRQDKLDLLKGADLPLDGLSIDDSELTYNNQKWDCMSGSEQLKVATAIVRKLNPDCGFVILDKLEQMDLDTLKEFGEWLGSEGLQAIATRVSTGGECSIIIEDGTGTLEAPEKKKVIPGQF
jgi:DNA repair exonuclease SbcCD ATPase subunit